ncbi:MAG: VCBS repeat-containing protein [bacterium]|nr:VCBS repeat-containing protein [bacterium]
MKTVCFRKARLLSLGLVALALILAAPSAQAIEQDPYISAVTSVTPASTTLGATTTYTFVFTIGTSPGQPANLNFHINGYGFCENWEACQPDFNNASLVSGISGEFQAFGNGFSVSSNSWNTGEYTVVISGVRNPLQAPGHYRAQGRLGTGDDGGENPPSTVSSPFFFGSGKVVKGTITVPGGAPASQSGVNIRSADFSYNSGGGTDEYGFYAFSGSGLVVGQNYFIEAWPSPEQSGYVAPDPAQITWNNATQTVNLQLQVATKTISGRVRYQDGSPVTSGGEVNAWKPSGGGGTNAVIASDGTYELALSGGNWELNLNAGWDQENNQPRQVDWVYNQPQTQVTFANNSSEETRTINFNVTKTDAVARGKVLMPNGQPLQGGSIEARGNTEGPGYHTGINGQDGSFTLNLNAGTYKLNVWPDQSNPDMARFFLPEVTFTVVLDENKNLGTLTMDEKTSRVTGEITLENGEPISDFRVNCWQTNGGFGWGEGRTNSNGVYSVWVSPGEWECDIDRHGGTEYILAESRPFRTYRIEEDQTVSDINFVLKRADASLEVKFVDTDGNAVTDVWGWAFARKQGGGFGPGSEFGSNLDRGTATIPLLGGDTYVVGMHLPPGEASLLLREEVTIEVPEGATVQIKLTGVEPNATIRVLLQDQNGQLIENENAEINAGSDEGGSWFNARLNPDGSANIGVLGGKRYFVGYWFHNNDEFVQTHPNQAPFTVPVGETVTKVLTAYRADSQVTAELLDPEGNEVPFGFVWCSDFKEKEDKVQGDFEGGSVIDAGGEIRDGVANIPLVAGTYTCGAGTGPDAQSTWMPPKEVSDVTVAPGSPAEITLQFREADATLSGSVTLPDGNNPPFGWCHAFSNDGNFSGGEVFDGQTTIPLTEGTWFIGCDTHTTDGFYRSDDTIVTVVKGKNLTQDFTLVKQRFDIPEGLTTRFSATSQKTLTLPDGTEVTIPANAFSNEDEEVTFIATPNFNIFHTEDTKPINYAWDFSALDSNQALVENFNQNVNICIPYDQELLDELGKDETNIVAKYFDDQTGTWKLPTGVTQDTEANKVCFSVNHFTDFALASSAGVGGTSVNNYDVMVTPLSGGGPQVILADENGSLLANFFAYSSALRIGVQSVTADVDSDGEYEIITAPGAGAGPQVRVFDHQGQIKTQFFAYGEGVRSGINVTAADLDGDGTAEIITSPMAGAGPQVRVFDADGNALSQFFAYAETYRGGLSVATGDVDGDGVDEIVTAPYSDAGPQIGIFEMDGTAVTRFFAYAENVRGGYNVVVGDVDGDGTADIVVSPKAGNGPQVAIFNGNGDSMNRFFAYAETFRGGIFASVGDVDGDGDNDIVVSPESGAGPQIRVFDNSGSVLSQFWAYASHLRGNFTSFVADLNGDSTVEIVTAPGAGMGPQVRTFDQNGNALSQFFSHHTGFRGGITIMKAL